MKLWPSEEASKLVKSRRPEQGQTLVFETGFGPSGMPHIGTFGEVVRTFYVVLALEEMGYKGHLIPFSDDMDGLRKVPLGFPSWLNDYVGVSLSEIPDPFGDEYESFSHRMNSMLIEMLDGIGLPYDFRSSTKEYRSGTFNRQIAAVIRNYEKVQEIVHPVLTPEKRKDWFPFFIRCESCNRIGTTRILEVDREALTVRYACDTPFGIAEGCGHVGEASVLDGNGKLQWRVDWAARWDALGVDYEMYGKDLTQSAALGREIQRKVLGSRPPIGMIYELFLAADATKISKSKGQGISVERWLRYGSLESLYLVMFEKPFEARKLAVQVIPRYMDRVHECIEAYFDGATGPGRDDVNRQTYRFITFFDPPGKKPATADYSTLCNLVGSLGIDDLGIISEYVRRVGIVDREADEEELRALIQKALAYYREQMLPQARRIPLSEKDARMIEELCAYLEAGPHEGEEIQTRIFGLAKENDVKPGDFFRVLYYAMLGQERGPRLGNFITMLGQERVAAKLRACVSEGHEGTGSPDPETVGPKDALVLAQEVQEVFPDLDVAVAIARGVEVRAEDDEAYNFIDDRLQRLLPSLPKEAAARETIAMYRGLYEEMEHNPNRITPMPEELGSLVAGSGRMPLPVNNVVDLARLATVETGLSVVVYDLAELELPLRLRFSADGDRFLPHARQVYEQVQEGELVYADGQEVLARMLNHAYGERGKVTTTTRHVLVVVDGSPGIPRGEIDAALDLVCGWLEQFAGAEIIRQIIRR